MDRPDDLEEHATPEMVKYVEFLEEGQRNTEESLATAQSITESWRKAHEEQESKARELQKQNESIVVQARGLAMALERTERNLREAHKREGVLALLLENERSRGRAAKAPGGEP